MTEAARPALMATMTTGAGSSPARASQTPPPDDSLFRVVIETSPYLYAILDADVRFTYLNPAVHSVLGFEPHELIGTSAADVIYPDDFDLAIGALAQLVDEFDERPDEGIPMAVRLIRKDGSLTYVEIGAIPRFDDPDVHGVIVRGRPMSGQQLLDQALEALVASSPLDDVLEYLVTSVEHELRGGRAAIGYGWDGRSFASVITRDLPGELCGDPDAPGRTAPDPLDAPWALALTNHERTVCATLDELPAELRAPAEAAGVISCWVVPVSVPPDNALVACIIVWRDTPGPPFVSHLVSLDRASRLTSLAFERRHTEELLRHAALHDTLTGIANRSQFFLRLEAAGLDGDADTDGHPDLVAVLYLDLDEFKPVNDTFGHGTGDDVLRAVTDRIAASVRPGDLVARLGGDEFAVLCTGLTSIDEATAVAERLIDAVGQPIELEPGAPIEVGLSVGVAVGPAAHSIGADLLDAADGALYEAKRAGKGRWRLAPTS